MFLQEVVEFHLVCHVLTILSHGRDNDRQTQVEENTPTGGMDGPWPAAPGGNAEPCCTNGLGHITATRPAIRPTVTPWRVSQGHQQTPISAGHIWKP